MPCPNRALLIVIVCVLLSAADLSAAKKTDPLARITPVAPTEQIPVSDFFRPGLFADPQLNAAGTHVVALVNMGGDRDGLAIIQLADMKLQTLQGSRGLDVYDYSWLNDDRILFSVGRDKLYSEGLFVADTKNLRKNYALEPYSAIRVLGRPDGARTKPLIWVRMNAYDEGRDSGVFQIDAMRNTGREQTAVSGAMGTKDPGAGAAHGVSAHVLRSFPTPPSGHPVVYFADVHGEMGYVVTIGSGEKLALFALDQGRWTQCPVDLEALDLEGVGEKPGELLVSARPGPGRPRALYRLEARTGALGEVLIQDDEYDVANVTVHREHDTHRILGVSYTARTKKTVWFDPKRQQVQAMVQRQFPGQTVTLLDADKAEDRFVVRTKSDRHPTAYHTLHLSQRSMGLLKNPRPWIDPARMRPQSIVSYKARDGASIEAYLTLPEGASESNRVPLVVMPHGGPWARDSWGWSPDVQFLASRGYAVLQPNYRGSTGYDWKFSEEDLADFRKMHEDVTDGVQSVRRMPMIDPERVAIMGGSFGGYLAMCGAAFEPDMYRCAVTLAGVFDWELMLAEARRNYRHYSRYKLWLKRIGDPRTESERLAAISPLRHVEKIKIPVFVQHGREDQVVAIEQSKRFVGELEKHGVEHVARFDKKEGHGTYHFGNRLELYTQLEAFLSRHLGPQP